MHLLLEVGSERLHTGIAQNTVVVTDSKACSFALTFLQAKGAGACFFWFCCFVFSSSGPVKHVDHSEHGLGHGVLGMLAERSHARWPLQVIHARSYLVQPSHGCMQRVLAMESKQGEYQFC